MPKTRNQFMVSTTAREAVAVVEQHVRRQRHLTLTEAAALTGLAIDEAREALDVLLQHYVCRMSAVCKSASMAT